MNNHFTGQYVPGDGFLYRLDARAKLLCLLLFTVAVIAANCLAAYLAVAASLLALLIFGRLRLRLVLGAVARLWLLYLMVFLTNAQSGLAEISKKSWLFLILSGLATGASWLCYYRALQIGEASKVVPVDKLSVVITLVLAFLFLHENFTTTSLLGCVLIGAGTLLMVL